ncbi:Mitochondrial transcription termination factor family protein [Hibiscus syriacus]|uniref:Mitochondrial transcription termination factor family protein n=1 Tax=Hibiscus syriacus TaxID=106335 RepID=A0A6A2X5X7_HIBSY|nr:uncharacterized protein LOC120174641 [Hibiscus syriacus]KAE8670633.1 Mitochondrial transcription termination factor family protein [Hibiscus syriacus]
MAKTPLRNLLSLIHNRFLQTNPTPSPIPNPPPLNPKRRKIPQNADPESAPFFNFLKSYGFNNTQIAKVVKQRPAFLHSRFNKWMKPKLEYFMEKGFEGKLLPQFVASNPLILSRSLESQIKPSLGILSQFLKDDELLLAIKRSSSWLFTSNLNAVIRPNIDFLINEGVSVDRISRLLVFQPRVILQSHARMVYAVKLAKEAGQPRFIHALRVICSVSESNWKKKVEAFMSVGWTKEEVFNTLRKDPICLACSERKLRYLMDFYVKTMKLDAKTIISYPKLILYSTDKRILARYEVLKVLKSMKLIKENKKIVWVFTLSEKKFKEEYITKNKDKVPGLFSMYQQAVKKRKTRKEKNETIDLKTASLTL